MKPATSRTTHDTAGNEWIKDQEDDTAGVTFSRTTLMMKSSKLLHLTLLLWMGTQCYAFSPRYNLQHGKNCSEMRKRIPNRSDHTCLYFWEVKSDEEKDSPFNLFGKEAKDMKPEKEQSKERKEDSYSYPDLSNKRPDRQELRKQRQQRAQAGTTSRGFDKKIIEEDGANTSTRESASFFKAEMLKYQNRATILEDALKDKVTDLNKMENRVEILQHVVQTLKEENETYSKCFQKELETEKRQIYLDLSNELKETKQSYNSKLQEKEQKYKTETADLNKKLSISIEDRKRIEEKVKDIEIELKEALSKLNHEEEELAKKEDVKAREAELRTKISSLEKSLTDSDIRYKSMKRKQENMSAQIQIAESAVKAAEEREVKLQNRIEIVQHELKSLLKEKENWKKDYDVLEQKYSEKINESTKEKTTLKSTIDSLKYTEKQVKSKLDLLKIESNVMKERNEKNEGMLRENFEQLLNDQREEYEKKICDMRRELEAQRNLSSEVNLKGATQHEKSKLRRLLSRLNPKRLFRR